MALVADPPRASCRFKIDSYGIMMRREWDAGYPQKWGTLNRWRRSALMACARQISESEGTELKGSNATLQSICVELVALDFHRRPVVAASSRSPIGLVRRDLNRDDNFEPPGGRRKQRYSRGRRCASSHSATASVLRSCRYGPTICTPVGKPPPSHATGTTVAGKPANDAKADHEPCAE